MAQKQENIDFLNKMKFFQNSNITNVLIKNLFNYSFIFTKDDFVDNTKLTDILSSTLELDSSIVNSGIWQNQIAYFRLPSISTDYDTLYQGGNRYYSNYRDNSDIINLGFFEDSNINIRRMMKTWIDLTVIGQKNVIDERGIPYSLYPKEYDAKELRLYTVSGKFESNFYEKYERIHPISIEDITLDLTSEAQIPIISVQFVYKKFGISKI